MIDSLHSVLNGKIFVVHINPDNNHMVISDVLTNCVLLESTHIVKKEETEDGFIVETSSGTVYDFLKVSSLIPTCEADDEPVVPRHRIVAPMPVDSIHIFRHINYGDGYNGMVFHFATAINYDEFLAYCKTAELNLMDKLENYEWYENHAEIIRGAMEDGQRIDHSNRGKSGDKSMYWTYLEVHPYTD